MPCKFSVTLNAIKIVLGEEISKHQFSDIQVLVQLLCSITGRIRIKFPEDNQEREQRHRAFSSNNLSLRLVDRCLIALS